MQQAVGTVLKKSQVRIGAAVNISQPLGGPGQCSGPSAQIVRQVGDETIVEITCSCGNKINVRCSHPPK